MAISIPQGYIVTSKEPIDKRLVLTKKQMRDVNDDLMPHVYFCICAEKEETTGKHKMYVYNKEWPWIGGPNGTGRFQGFAGYYPELEGLPSINGLPVLGSEDGGHYKLQNKLYAIMRDGQLSEGWISVGPGIEIDNLTWDSEHLSGIKVLIDSETIKTDGDVLYVDVNRLLNAGEGVKFVPDGKKFKLDVKYIDPVFVNDDNQLDIKYDPNRAIELSEGKIAVRVDGRTIKFVDGKLVSFPEPLYDGIATEVRHKTSEWDSEAIDVLFHESEGLAVHDNKLYVKIDDEHALEFVDGKIQLKIKDSEGLDFAADGKLQVKINETQALEFDSEGKIRLKIIESEGLAFNDGKLFIKLNESEGLEFDDYGNIKVRIDDDTIHFDEGILALHLDSERGITTDSEGKIFIKVDNSTIHFDSEGKLELYLGNSEGLGVHNDGKLYVKIDDSTIHFNSNGELYARSGRPGEAIELTSEGGEQVINVRYDDLTVKLGSEGSTINNKLYVPLNKTKAIDVDSNGLFVKFDGDGIPVTSEDSTIIVRNGKLKVKNAVPNFFETNKRGKALRVNSEGNLEWMLVSDIDDIALKMSDVAASEGAKYQNKYYLASSESINNIPTLTPIRYDENTRTVYVDLSSKQNKINDGKLVPVTTPSGTIYLLNPEDIYQNTSANAPDDTRLFLSKEEKDKLAYKPVWIRQILVHDSEGAVRDSEGRPLQFGHTSIVNGEKVYGNLINENDPLKVGLDKVSWTGNYLDLDNKVDVRKLYYDVTDNTWKLVNTTAKDKLTPVQLVKSSSAGTGKPVNTFDIGVRLDNNSIRVNSEGAIYSRGFVLNASEGDIGKALIAVIPSTTTTDAVFKWGEAGKVDGVDLIEGGTNNRLHLVNKIVKLHIGDGLDFSTSENSEGILSVDLYESLPQIGTQQIGKALIVDSERHLAWGEAGKVDALKVRDSQSHEKQLNPVNKIVTVDFERGLQVSSEGKIGHINEVAPQTRAANQILVPMGTDNYGHIIDGTAATIANGLREVTFKEVTNAQGTYVSTNDWAYVKDPNNATTTTNVGLKIAGINPSSAALRYNNATLKIDANGLSANYKSKAQKLVSTDATSEQIIIIDGNKLSLNDLTLRRLQLLENAKGVIDSEGLRNNKYYPTINLLNTELNAKQDLLTDIGPIVIGSEGDSEHGHNSIYLKYDNKTIVLNNKGQLKAKDVDLPVNGELSDIVPYAASEGNPLVDEDLMYDSLSSNLGVFRGNFDSEGSLPTKAQEPALMRNDYAFITVPVYTSEGVQYFYHRYKYIDDTSETGHWEFEYRVSGSTFTKRQLDALNSMWNLQLTTRTVNHLNDRTIHITSEDRRRWNNKQEKLTASTHINATALAANQIKVDDRTSIVDASTYDSYLPTIGAVKGYFKKKQTAVDSNSSATNSEAAYFISRITQNDQGVITPVRTEYTYNNIPNKPSINGVTLSGNKTFAQLGLAATDGVKIDTDGKTIKHTNAITAVTNKQAYKITLDAQGHVNTAPELYQPDWNKSYNVRTNTTDSDYIKKAPWVKQGTDANKDAVVISTGTASGTNAVAMAGGRATGEKSLATGTGVASGTQSVALGSGTASGNYSFARGGTASGLRAIAFSGGTATGENGFAEGYQTTAEGSSSHAEGQDSVAHGSYSHAEGLQTRSNGLYSHAEGTATIASGSASHAEGSHTETSANYTHAEGYYTKTSSRPYQHVQGAYNVPQYNAADIVGWGTSEGARKNISTLMTNGDLHLAGQLYINSKPDGTGGLQIVPPLTSEGYVLTIKTLPSGTSAGELEWKRVQQGSSGATYSASKGITITNSNDIQHTNSVAANTTSGLKFFTYDAQGHVTRAVNKTIGRGIDDKSNVIGHSNTAITANTTDNIKTFGVDTYGHVTGYTVRTLGRGIGYGSGSSANEIGHTNSVTAATNVGGTTGLKVPYFSYDTQGHFTGSGEKDVFPSITGKNDTWYLAVNSAGTGLTWKQLDLPSEGIQGVAGTDGITVTGTSGIATVKHTNAITAQSTKEVYNITYDAQGHITGSPTLYNPDWPLSVTSRTVASPTDSDIIKTVPFIKQGSDSGKNAVVINNDNTASGAYSVAEGYNTTASGAEAHAEGTQTTASGGASHAEGGQTIASELYSHAEGAYTRASGFGAHAEGGAGTASGAIVMYGSTASGASSHAEGYYTNASGTAAHAEGMGAGSGSSMNTASGTASHAEGYGTTASGNHSHAEGNGAKATSQDSHAEGLGTTSSGTGSHAEGNQSTASGNYSHAEGQSTTASGAYSHAEGIGTSASVSGTHAEGYYTSTGLTTNSGAHVQGKYNVVDREGELADTVGWGTSTTRKNISALTTSGDLHLSGAVYINAPTNYAADSGLKLVPTLTQVGDVLKIKTMPTSTSAGELEWGAGGGGGTTYTASKGITISSNDIQHTNSVTAQTTQAFYPIKIDAQGHISAYGSGTQIAKYNNEGQNIGTTVNITYTPYNSTTQSSYVPTFNWLAFWKGNFNTSGGSNLQYGDKGQLVGTGLTTRTVGADTAGAEVPVYVNNGTITAMTTTSGGTAKPIYLNAGKLSPISATVGRAGSATQTAQPVYLNDGTITACSLHIPYDAFTDSKTYLPIYLSQDNTAGDIADGIRMPAQAAWSFSVGNRKWKYTSTDGTALTFGLTKVESW